MTPGPRLEDMLLLVLGSQNPPSAVCLSSYSQLRAGGINIHPTIKLEKLTSLVLIGDF